MAINYYNKVAMWVKLSDLGVTAYENFYFYNYGVKRLHVRPDREMKMCTSKMTTIFKDNHNFFTSVAYKKPVNNNR